MDINGHIFTTWVHHTADLSRRSESSRQAKFRTAMAGLETDDPDLPKLIHIVEKVIFDDHNDVDPKVVKRSTGKVKTEDHVEKTVRLSISHDDIKKKASR